MAQLYDSAVVFVLAIHLAWILWIIFGAFWTRRHRWLTIFHIVSLVWGIVVEASPWPCPLTLAEQHFQRLAGTAPYRGSFLLHYLDSIVYPNVSVLLLTICGVAVCVVNLAIYGRRLWVAVHKGHGM
jgi:hypothetical protein